MKLLEDAYKGMVEKVENLKLEKVLSHKRIARASLLTDALAGEKVSEWMNTWINAWISEWMNEWMNEWVKEWIN